MHEYSIVRSLLDQVEEEARRHRATAVRRVRVAIGELSGVEIDLLEKAFSTFSDRSLCGGAKLEIERVAAQWGCPRCRHRLPRGSVLRCPRCRRPARLQAGDEIVLRRIEMEVA